MLDVVDAMERLATFRENLGKPARDVAALYSQAWPRLMDSARNESDPATKVTIAERAEAMKVRADELWAKVQQEQPAVGAAAEQHPAEVGQRAVRRRGQGGGIGF